MFARFNLGVEEGVEGTERYYHGYPLQNIAKDGHLVYSPKPPRGVTEKCTFALNIPESGIEYLLVASGVQVTRGRILRFDDPNSEISQYLNGKNPLLFVGRNTVPILRFSI